MEKIFSSIFIFINVYACYFFFFYFVIQQNFSTHHLFFLIESLFFVTSPQIFPFFFKSNIVDWFSRKIIIKNNDIYIIDLPLSLTSVENFSKESKKYAYNINQTCEYFIAPRLSHALLCKIMQTLHTRHALIIIY